MGGINLCPLHCNVDVNSCVKGLWASRRLGRPKSAIKKLNKEMAVLKAKRNDIKNKIKEEEREGKIPTNEVRQWLQEVEILEGEVADIEQDYQTMRCFGCNCFSCSCFNQIGGTSSQTQEAAGDQVPIRESSSNYCSIILRVVDKLEEAEGLMKRAVELNPIVTDLSRLESGIQKLEKEMAKLRAKRDDIKNEITEAEREGKIPTNQVSQWLEDVETLEGQVIGIKQDFQIISCFSCNNCFNQTGGTSSQTQQVGDQVPIRESSNCCSINRRATEKLREANELMNRASQLNPIVIVGPPEHSVMLPISNQPLVGIDSYVKEIVSYIDGGGEGNIIGIHGMDGIGKTTILNSIWQHYFPKQTKYYRVIRVVASKDHQLKKLQMDIAKELELNTLQENDDAPTCRDNLFKFLKDKNCLLLLDDIWECVDLQMLGMAHSATEQGQQQQQPYKIVVFTTCIETVCVQMKAKKEIKVKYLDEAQAWQLFQENSNKDVLNSNAGIKFVAKELAKECAGLPLALITVARAMSGKKSWYVWNDTLNKIRNEHQWTAIGVPVDSLVMYKAFKLSYDSLENDSIRKCLLCCALWPKDCEIDQFKELIPYWIGCGIIRDFNVINEAFAKGCSHLEALVAASLLEKCSDLYFPYKDRGVKMHDIIRDMALLMVSGLEGSKRKWIVKAGFGLSDLLRQEEWQEVERAFFLMMNDITFLQDYGTLTFPKLSMLILYLTDCSTILPNLFASMPHLTYLDLRKCRITELPREICNLTELQYLNLCSNPITTLPVEFGCLSKLEYLLLRDTVLEIVPNGMISKLSMLKWLDIANINPAPEWWYDELKCFKGRHRLSVEIDINATTDNIERLNMLPKVSIWKLTLYIHDISELPNCDLGTPQWGWNIGGNLEGLRIENIGLDRLVLAESIGSESNFRCLKELKFCSLKLLEEISLNRVGLCNLHELYIFECPRLKDVSCVLQLPCLGVLSIRNCQRMKELIITDVDNSNSSSSSIQRLSLISMSNLNRIANRQLDFPYLDYIRVDSCPKLKNLSFGTEILKNCRLKCIEGDDSWWNNLDWDDESIRDSLARYFRPRRP